MPRASQGSGAPRRRAEAPPAPPERAAPQAVASERSARQAAPTPEAAAAAIVAASPDQPVQPPIVAAESPQRAPRFRIFIVDTGWDSAAHRVLKENFWLLRELQKDDPIYVLGREQSIEYMRHNHARIGHDPIIAVHDMSELNGGGAVDFHGFRLRLGLLRTRQQALMALQNFSRFLISHRDSTRFEADIRAGLRREGLAGAIEIVLTHEAREIGA